jgi:prepilin-type processing-associated H-X9-DG protein
MSDKQEIYPEYLTDPRILICPSEPDAAQWIAKKEDAIDDEAYFYLGYAVTSDNDVATYCTEYKQCVGKGKVLDGDLSVPTGTGSCGGDVLLQLKEGVQRFFITDINNPASVKMQFCSIPVLIERPENHGSVGGNVLFIDGHVEFMRFPGQWPMTEKTIAALKELDAMGK